MRRVPTLACAALVVVAMAGAALRAPTPVTTPLTALAVVAVLVQLVRRRGRGPLDALLVGLAAPLIALPLLGFVLNLVPGGLSHVSWAIGVGVLLLAALGWDASGARTGGHRRRAAGPEPQASTSPAAGPDRRAFVRTAPWYVGAAGLLALAIVLATQAAHRSERPPLALSVVHDSVASADVSVSSGTSSGRFTLVVTDGSTTSTVGPFRLDRYTTTRRTVRLTAGRPTTVTLQRAGSADALRTLTLN